VEIAAFSLEGGNLHDILGDDPLGVKLCLK